MEMVGPCIQTGAIWKLPLLDSRSPYLLMGATFYIEFSWGSMDSLFLTCLRVPDLAVGSYSGGVSHAGASSRPKQIQALCFNLARPLR